MQTIDDVISFAASLDRANLAKLRTAIECLEKQANAIVLSTSRGITFRLLRLNEQEHRDMMRRSLPIEEDYGFYLQLFREKEALNLAEVYLTLKHAAGESSDYLDEYKMAFSFPFAMDVVKDCGTFAYHLEIRNIRDSLYFTLRRRVSPDDVRLKDHRIHQPIETEFGREDIRYFMCYLYGYLEGRWKVLRTDPPAPFVRKVPANLIILGSCSGRVFEEHYDSSDEFDVALRRYEAQVKQELQETEATEPCIVWDKSSCQHGDYTARG